MIQHIRILSLALTLSAGAAMTSGAQQLASSSSTTAAHTAPVGTLHAQQLPTQFWQAFGDTTLQRLMVETLRANHDIQIARARVSGARAARNFAAFELTPAVIANSGYTRQRISSSSFPGGSGGFPDQDVWDAGLRMSWELDLFGRLRRSLQGQGALLGAATEDVRDVQVLLTAQVANAYFALRGAQDRLAVARRNAANQRGTLDVTLQRLEGGRGTALDTERAKALLSGTLAVIPTLEATIEVARYRIGVLTGRGAADAPALADDTVEVTLPEVLAPGRVDSLVRRRPDVLSAERQVAASRAFVGAARAEYLPRVAIGGAAGYTGGTFESLGNSDTPRYAIGPVISLPLDLGRVRAGVDAARAGETQSRARYEQVVLLAQEEVASSLITYRKARERLQHLDDAAAASERAAELARLRYTEGASDFLQVLDAERTLLDRQDERALGRTEATTGLVAVYRALRGTKAFTLGGVR
ncbi:MAG: TolC family protein [Gemmatimonadota bacterium]|nr:TolC family protein [Gemmatimonadota bacterium]